jgi:dimethyladenosine transferase
MSNLGTPEKTLEIIGKYGFHFQKKYGQNFLIEKNIIENIISSSGIDKDDCVLEIGPGIGTMTEYLCKNSKFVIAVEIDKNLIPILEETLKDYDNKIIINQDILKTDISDLSLKYNNGKPIKVVANLPYYITTPIIMGLFEKNVPLKSITVMIQKEVADRMRSKPKTKDYGALALAVQFYSKPEVIAEVSKNCFIPRPKVSSSVIKLTKFEKPPINVKNEKFMFKVIRAAFNQRRKTLQNALSTLDIKIKKEELLEIFKELNLEEKVRGEALTLDEFARLADRLYEISKNNKN